MDEEKLELIHLLKEYSKDEFKQILTIMVCWDEMVNIGIVSKDDINNLSNLSKDKQNKIKKFVSQKLAKSLERKQNERRKSKEKEL